MSEIHSTAIIDPAAQIGEGVRIGPYCVIEGSVTIGSGTTIGPHSCLEGPLVLGPDCRVGKHATLGSPPQDLTYRGEPTRLEIGRETQLGDGVNISRGTIKGGGLTRIGDGCMLMAYCHVGHDCVVENRAVIATYSALAGHVELGEEAYVSGGVMIHQFVRLGRLALAQGGSGLGQDLPPFGWAGGCRARIQGINRVGLKRAGLSSQSISEIRRAYKRMFRSGTPLTQAIEQLRQEGASNPEVELLLDFCARESHRGILSWR